MSGKEHDGVTGSYSETYNVDIDWSCWSKISKSIQRPYNNFHLSRRTKPDQIQLQLYDSQFSHHGYQILSDLHLSMITAFAGHVESATAIRTYIVHPTWRTLRLARYLSSTRTSTMTRKVSRMYSSSICKRREFFTRHTCVVRSISISVSITFSCCEALAQVSTSQTCNLPLSILCWCYGSRIKIERNGILLRN